MKILMDGRVLAAKPSGVRDIASGMVQGFKQLAREGLVDFLLAGCDNSFDQVIPAQGYMHAGLPWTAARIGADRIFVPRQTRPLLSSVQTVPLFHDIGFFRLPDAYPTASSIGATTRLAALSRKSLSVSQFTAMEMAEAGIAGEVQALPIQAIHSLNWVPDEEDKYILCIAVQEPHKNLVRLVEAWDEAETGTSRLVICGRLGAESDALNRVIADSKKSSRIEVKSGLSDHEYVELLNGCWGYIQPSLYEGLCIPALDLAAAGAPTAVSSSGNLGALYMGAPRNQVFEATSRTDIAESIGALLHDQGFRNNAVRWNTENIKLTDWRKVAAVALEGMR